MKIFDWLFGRKSASGSPPPPAAGPKPTARDNELVNVFDAYGRELQITRREWRDNVLAGTLEQHRDDPDRLYSVIVQALQDGFFEDVLPFAKHLQTIDPLPSRSCALVGVIQLALDRLNEAEQTLQKCLADHGEDAYVLCNLAKVHAKRGSIAQADAILWRSLELDPNQQNALEWFWVEAKERGGESSGHEALCKLAALPGSWRARLWMARTHLEQQQVEAALQTYDEAMAAVPRPVPSDFLMQMSGDLGNHGQLVELLKRITPVFDAAMHGLAVGNNLIKANVDLGRLDHARAIVDQLYGQSRPDYQATLSFWETEIAKARVASENAHAIGPLSMTMLRVEGPIWLTGTSPAATLFASKTDDAVAVCMLGSSADTGATGEPHWQMADAAGRISRSLPLFLAEQVHLRTTASASVLQPWMAPGSFILSGKPWDSEIGVDQAKACQPPADYVVLTHLVAVAGRNRLEFRLVRCIDGSLLESGGCDFDPANLEPAYCELTTQLVNALGTQPGVDLVRQSADYGVPAGLWFNDYQLRLEQALAIRAAALGTTHRDFLSGEREIIAGMLHLCLAGPGVVSTRILLLDSLRRLKVVCPQIVTEFRDKIALFHAEHPAPEVARSVLDAMVAEAIEA